VTPKHAGIVEPEEKAVGRQRFVKHVATATNIRNNRRAVGRDVFYAVRVVSNIQYVVISFIPELVAKNVFNFWQISFFGGEFLKTGGGASHGGYHFPVKSSWCDA
jgi:hypothetical protein